MSLIIGQCWGYLQLVSVYMYLSLCIGESLTSLFRFAFNSNKR